jgi:hypothetical protein
MSTPQEAEEHLRVIRSLMERSTIYRAISAPVALVGGLASLAACALFALNADTSNDEGANLYFLAAWLVVLTITALANIYFLWNDATRRGDVFLSPGLRAALRALLPSCLTAGVLSCLLFLAGNSYFLPLIWIILYGLGLLATQHFAPRSIILLGWAFLAGGLCSVVGLCWEGPYWFSEHLWRIPNLAMGATFGLFHLVYAACAWLKKPGTANTGAEP